MFNSNHKTLIPILLGFTILLFAGGAYAQGGYSVTNNVPFSYIDIAGTGTGVLSNEDDATAVLQLPFPFSFYGVNYTSLCVSTNGLITFRTCPVGDVTNLDLTAQIPAGNLPLIAPFWMDLTFSAPGAGAVMYQTLGTAGARRFIVQWNNVFPLNSRDALNFQVILFEGTNKILFQYEGVETSSSSTTRGAGSTVGIRGSNPGERVQWSVRAPILTDRMALEFSPSSSVTARIDLKPGENPNCVNPASKGTVPVVIFGSNMLQAADIQKSSLRLGGASPRTCAVDDVLMETSTGVFSKDGIPDLMCHFETQEVTSWPAAGSDCARINLTGTLKSGLAITGSDFACRVAEKTCKAGTPIPIQ
jgi:hypothetical protein